MGNIDELNKEHNLYCPHCGASYDKDDIYCGKCGHKLKQDEEEYLFNFQKNASFNVTNFLKSLSYLFLITIIFLSFISLVGLFGDFLHYSDNTTVGLDFFSKMAKEINEARSHNLNRLAHQIETSSTLELFIYIFSYLSVIFSLIIAVISLIKLYQKDKLPTAKLFYIQPLISALHPLFLNLTYSQNITYEDGYHKDVLTELGWGAKMIFIASLITIIMILIYSFIKRMLLRKEEKKLTGLFISLASIQLVLNISFVLVIFFATSDTVNIDLPTYRGHASLLPEYVNYLATGKKPFTSITYIKSGYIFCLVGFLSSLIFIALLDNKKSLLKTISGALCLVLLAIGFSLSYDGGIESLNRMGYGVANIASEAIKYSILGIVIYCLIPIIVFYNLIKNYCSK